MTRLCAYIGLLAVVLLPGGCAMPEAAPGAMPRAPSAPIATTRDGTLRGVTEGELSVFRGIPYAAPPVGELRWAPPQPPKGWEGIRDASAFGPACIQPTVPPQSLYYDPPAQESEDCLTLNIWTPADAHNAPVVLWIHGGALRIGASSLPMYNGAQYAHRGVVFVSLNYRLGALGWMAHEELSAQSPNGVSGNYGLLDQVAALAWLRENAASFGGDPANITIMGESAGALSASYLLASPRADGLFDKAIIQSPNARAFPELSVRANGLASAEALGALALRAMRAQDIEDARALDARVVIDRTSAAGFAPQGTIDGEVLPDQLIDIFEAGEQAKVPVIVGFNGDEIRSQRGFLPQLPETEAEYRRRIEAAYGELAPQFLRLYPASGGEQSALDALRDGIYGWAAERIAHAQAQSGVPAFLYVFDHCYPAADTRELCGFHASDVPFVFGNLSQSDLPPNWPVPDGAEAAALSETMIDYWVSFIQTGTPRAPGHDAWLSYDRGEAYMLFDHTPEAGHDPFPGMFELNEAFVARRRAAGQNWGLLIGLAAADATDDTQ